MCGNKNSNKGERIDTIIVFLNHRWAGQSVIQKQKVTLINDYCNTQM